MSVWLNHVKETRKKCPGMSFKEVLKEAKKTYNKKTKTAGPVVCAKKGKSVKRKSKRVRRRKSKSRKGRRKTSKLSRNFKCKMFPNAPYC